MERKYYTGEQILDALSEVRVGAGDISEVMSCLGRMPSAEKTGQWILSFNGYENTWICSECGEEYVLYDGTIAEQHYCPNCGAKMEAQDD